MNPLVTITLQTLIRDLLRGEHYVPISTETAEILIHHTRNQHSCHIQFPSDQDVDIYGRFIEVPMLWDLGAWRMSSEKILRARVRSQKEREQRFIFEANIKLVARKIHYTTNVDFEICKLQARKWLNNNEIARILAVGVKQLYTKVEELP